jgi:membrane protein implicated in regulation of membrane protease activity
VRSGAGTGTPIERLAPGFLNWVLGIAVVYSTLFGIGELLFGTAMKSTVFIVIALMSAVVLSRRLAEVKT